MGVAVQHPLPFRPRAEALRATAAGWWWGEDEWGIEYEYEYENEHDDEQGNEDEDGNEYEGGIE